MRFGDPQQKERRESIVPMINVVFLLLVFLLLTAQMASAPPLEIDPPKAQAEPGNSEKAVLYVAADGTLAYGDRVGEEALKALPNGQPLLVQADASLPATKLVALLPQLAKMGEIRLVTIAP